MCLVWSQAVFVRSPSCLTTVRSPSYSVSDMPETLFSAYTTPSTRPLITAQPEPPRILLPYRQIFNKLWVRHTSRHSPRILANPRSRNRRKPRASLIWPKTGSTITFRREYTARPSALFQLRLHLRFGRRGRRSRLRRRGGGRIVVPLPLRRDVRIETLTLHGLHRGPTPSSPYPTPLGSTAALGLIRSRESRPGPVGHGWPARSARPVACRCTPPSRRTPG